MTPRHTAEQLYRHTHTRGKNSPKNKWTSTAPDHPAKIDKSFQSFLERKNTFGKLRNDLPNEARNANCPSLLSPIFHKQMIFLGKFFFVEKREKFSHASIRTIFHVFSDLLQTPAECNLKVSHRYGMWGPTFLKICRKNISAMHFCAY